jgi:hypothetical protein
VARVAGCHGETETGKAGRRLGMELTGGAHLSAGEREAGRMRG